MYRMNVPKSSCPHINTVGDYTKEDIIEKQETTCDSCDNAGPNLWVCLHRDCLYVGCSDNSSNHSIKHFQKRNEHSLFLNLTSLRVYCLLCECEVFLENNDPPIPGMLPTHPLISKSDSDSEEEFEAGEDGMKQKGLTGLQNLGNTCYMNSAIQSLSNCPQLTNFFLECGSFIRADNKPGLARTYMRLMKEMWHKKRPSYVVPSGITYGIKIVCPAFRGYSQQDAQEFLRCFLDQLHEELKEPAIEISSVSSLSPEGHEEYDSARGESLIHVSEDSSQSDAEYETCDSGLSSEKSSCGDEAVETIEPIPESLELISPSSSCSTHISSKQSKRSKSNFSVNHITTSPPEDILMSCDKNEIPSVSKEKGKLGSDTHSPSALPNHFLSLTITDVCISCDKSDTPLFKDDSISSPDAPCMSCDDCCSDNKQTNPGLWNDNYNSASSGHSSFKGVCAFRQASHHKFISSHPLMSSLFTRKRKPVRYRSIISDIFDGKILSSVQCLTCDTLSATKETFQDLSLPIPNNRDHLNMIHASQGNHPKGGGTCTDVYSHQGWLSSFFGWILSWFWGPSVSLQDCLSAFFSADELKGDNMYSCEKCKKLRNGIKYSKVIELPEVLCIHLKRFRHEVMFSSKINNYVSFPLEGLDMSPFVHKSYPQGITTYDLVSVICHHGTAGSGHYTAYCLNYLNDQWYEFDDQYVTAVDTEMVRHCEAYVLFYRKSGEEMIKKRQCAVELMDRSKNELGLLKFHISKQWINKFNNFAEPGPITNTDFLCIHGGVPPQKAPYAEDLCTILPQAVWEYLHDTFGGGPPCTHLYICPICQAEQDSLNQKRKLELEEFIAMNAEFQAMENPSVIYAISMTWFKMWENFVCKEGEPPGPIDNSSICFVKNNQAVLKLGSDYCSVSKEMYQYLQSIYGGGPDIALQPNGSSYCCPQFLFSGSSVGRTKSSTSSASYNFAQNAQVHSIPRTSASSHNVLSASSITRTSSEPESSNKNYLKESESPLNSEEKLQRAEDK